MQRIDKLPHLLLSKLRYFLTGTKLMPKEKTSAMFHNSIENVDALNENEKHWLTSRKLDKRFIDIIYRDVISLCLIDENCTIADFGCGTGVLVSEAPRGKPRGILNSKEGDCIPLTPAPHSSPPLMAGYSAGVS